jgi:glycine/D-amino acid oxidase-like deaminating enzyme
MTAESASAGPALLTPDFAPHCYWWDATPPAELGEPTLPARADAVVVGSGYTGLNAALQLARAGRSTLVLDAEAIGWGCSTRNGGQVSTSIKPGFEALAAAHGRDRARRIIAEGHRSLAWLGEFLDAEAIACDFRVCGRFHAAHSAREYDALARQLENAPGGIAVPAEMVPRSEQAREIGTDAYHGGVVFTRHAALDPARYHRGLFDRVVAAGATIVPHCAVSGIRRDGGEFRVATSRGTVAARDVIVATNGYTGRATPWLRRRVIPIGSYIIATEPIAPADMAHILPTDRVVTDTRKVVYYYRASPDRTRILFGGRVAWDETDPRVSAPRLKAELARLFPALAGTRVSHSWMGFVAYTFDALMHTGRHDGIHYAAGYCGSGVGMASYLGMKLGLKALGRREGETAFDGLRFPTRPYYFGWPWFLAPSIAYYRWRDRRS